MTAITTAARLLREAAAELKNAHTLGGDWGNEHEALDAYNEHMATATTLEHTARQCLAQIEEPAAPAAVSPQADLDADLGRTVDQRDTAEGWADGLAGLIGKYFGRDIGEHSSAHCPWQEAKDIIEEAEPYHPAAVTGPAWDKTRDSLATLLLGLARRPFLDFDVACIALDAATEPGMPLAYMRGAPAAPALEAPAAPVGSARQFIEWMYSQPEDREPTTAEGALLEFEAHLAAAAPQAPAAPAVDARDTARMDWLQTKAVSVRDPMHDGPSEIFWSGPVDRAGMSAGPSDLRARIDAAQAKEGGAA